MALRRQYSTREPGRKRLLSRLVSCVIGLTVCGVSPAFASSAEELHPGGFFVLTREGKEGHMASLDSTRTQPLPRLHSQQIADQTAWQTGSGTRLIFALTNGTTLGLDSDTILSIERFMHGPITADLADSAPFFEPSRSELHLRLTDGTLAVRSGELRANSILKIQLGDARLILGGGIFEIRNQLPEREIKVYFGNARLEQPDQESRFLAAGDRLLLSGNDVLRENLPVRGLAPGDHPLIFASERGFRRFRIFAAEPDNGESAQNTLPVLRIVHPPRRNPP